MIVEVTERASQELAEAIAWYESKEPGVGRRFYDDVMQRLTSLPTVPAARFRKVPRSRHGVLFVEVGKPWPYRIFVRRRGDALEVIAFAHHHRADDHWTR